MLPNPEAQQAISRFSFNDALVMEGTVERFMANLQEFMSPKPEDAERLSESVRSQVEQAYSGPGGISPDSARKPGWTQAYPISSSPICIQFNWRLGGQ